MMGTTAGPTILGIDVLLVATILSGVAAFAVMVAIYAATSVRDPFGAPGDWRGKSGLAATERLLMRHLGYARSTSGRTYPASWAQCGQRHPFVRHGRL